MCGICGIYNFNQTKVEKEKLIKMCRSLKHRGPNDEGLYVSKNIGLGNRRLSIIDLGGGHQPVHNEDETIWITFNGEIYNFLKLRESLLKKGHRFYTNSDTEVIIHLYEEYKEKCVDKLNGMFAFGIWDGKKEQLFLVRDPVGEKPLFWTVFENKLLFASEIKAILAFSGFVREIDEDSLAKYFLYNFIPSPQSIFKGIKKLLPGYFLIIGKKGEIKEKKYWEIDYSKKLSEVGFEEVKGQVENVLEKAVEERLISDVPLGVCLSGGVDSSLVTSIMAKKIGADRVEAFTIGFREKSFDESDYASMVAKHLKVKHHLRIFSQKELFHLLPKVVEVLDEPMADSSILPTFLLSEFAGEKIKVVLSGDGGDESFGGYPKYLAHWFLEKSRLNKLPFLSLCGNSLGRFGKFIKYMSSPLYLRNQLWINNYSKEEVKQLTGQRTDFSDIEKYHRVFNGKDILDEAFFLDQKLTLADLYLVKTDRASMANSLEIRSPFLDKNLVELGARIPFEVKLKGFRTKALLKEIALKYLPAEAIFRPKKGFGIPLKKWLEGEARPLIKKTILRKKDSVLNSAKVAEIVEKGTSHQIWSLLIFNLWKERWLKN